MEIQIAKFKLPLIEDLSLVNLIVRLGYKLTGNKFCVSFNGSKGYLSNIEITAEGIQKEQNNIIWVERLTTKRGALKSKLVEIFYSEENGVRVLI